MGCFAVYTECNNSKKRVAIATLPVATILVAMALKFWGWQLDLQRGLPKPKELVASWRPSKNLNLEGCLGRILRQRAVCDVPNFQKDHRWILEST